MCKVHNISSGKGGKGPENPVAFFILWEGEGKSNPQSANEGPAEK